MKDILGKEIVGYEEALYLKDVGFNNLCTGYYHSDDYLDEVGATEDDRYECVGWRGLFRNSYSKSRAAAPSIRAAKMWYTKNAIRPYKQILLYSVLERHIDGSWWYHPGLTFNSEGEAEKGFREHFWYDLDRPHKIVSHRFPFPQDISRASFDFVHFHFQGAYRFTLE